MELFEQDGDGFVCEIADSKRVNLYGRIDQAIVRWCQDQIGPGCEPAALNFEMTGSYKPGPGRINMECRRRTGSTLFLEGTATVSSISVMAFSGIMKLLRKARK